MSLQMSHCIRLRLWGKLSNPLVTSLKKGIGIVVKKKEKKIIFKNLHTYRATYTYISRVVSAREDHILFSYFSLICVSFKHTPPTEDYQGEE